MVHEHIDRIEDQLGVTIEYLIRGDENTQYALTGQETVLVEGFRKLSDETEGWNIEKSQITDVWLRDERRKWVL